MRRPGKPLNIDRPPACHVFLNFQEKTFIFIAGNVILKDK
jgi:hypothetical protein